MTGDNPDGRTRSRQSPATATQSPRRFLGWSPLRLAGVNVALALSVASGLKAFDVGPAVRAPTTLRDAVRAWMPERRPSGALTRLTDDLAHVDTWIEGKRRYAETLAVLRPAVPLPPAGAATANPFPGAARMLAIGVEQELPPRVKVEIRYSTDVDGETLSQLPALVGPFWQSAQIALRLTLPGGLFQFARQSEWRPAVLREGAETILEFPEAADWAPSARLSVSSREPSALDQTAHEGFAPEVVEAEVIDDRADWSLPWRSGGRRPQVRKLGSGSELRNAATLEIRGRRRYVGLCVWSPSGRPLLVRVRRSDTRQFVGARAPDLPLLAAIADRHAVLQVELAAHSARDLADVEMLAVTSDDSPGLPLFVEAIGRALAQLRHNGVTLDGDAHRRAGLWLRGALGVEWTDRDVESIRASDAELAAILTALHEEHP
jgi:hypothetical protein